MPDFTSPEILAALATLTVLEIVLGIDNIVFISIISSKLPRNKQDTARKLGLAGALVIRLLFLFLVVWIIGLEAEIFKAFDISFSWKDLILIAGGLFLLAKGTHEIHENIEGDSEHLITGRRASAKMFVNVVAQIMVLDVVFSIDSILTAIGMTRIIEIMVIAIVISIGVMMWAVTPLSAFIEKHPTVKMLALSFLLLIGMALIADGMSFHIPRGYLYFAIIFSIFVEGLNLAARRNRERRKARKKRRFKP
jgi:predicted tellurium resistance membrane protein TerC